MKRKFIAYTCMILFALGSTAQNQDGEDNLKIVEAPIMGWSSWNTYRVNIGDKLIRKQADAMVSTGLKNAGYSYVNIDDGFFGWRDEDGVLHTHPERFPNGLKGICLYSFSFVDRMRPYFYTGIFFVFA